MLGTFAAKAMHLETSCPLVPSRVVVMPNLQAEMNSNRSSTISLMGAASIFFALQGSVDLLPVSALAKDILRLEVVKVLECVLFGLTRGTVSERIGSMKSLVEHSCREMADFIATLEKDLPFIA